MNIFSVINPAVKLARKHLPEVATGIGVILDGAAVIFGIKDTPHAMEVLEQKKPDTFMQKAEVAVTSYWRTILCFTLGTFLIFRGQKLQLERTAFALGLAATQRDKLAAMTEETKKLLGPKKVKELEENVAVRDVDVKKIESVKPVNLGGDQKFICKWNNFAFYSTVSQVKDKGIEIMEETMKCKCIDESDVDYIMGFPNVREDRGDNRKGWNIDHPPKLKIVGWEKGSDGEPIGILDIEPPAQPGWVLDSGYLF